MVTNQPNDPLFNDQWHLFNNGQKTGLKPGIDLNVVPIWNNYTGKGIKVGVLEGGTPDISHPDLITNYDPNLDYNAVTDDGNVLASPLTDHATATSGIIAATANNSIGGVGVAYGATIANFRINYSNSALYGARAFNQALLNGIDVLNNSWGCTTIISPEETLLTFILQKARSSSITALTDILRQLTARFSGSRQHLHHRQQLLLVRCNRIVRRHYGIAVAQGLE